MRKIVYYVAISLDGFICGPDEDVSGFVSGGNGVEQYLNDLKTFDTVIMGRKTYEFGYKFGLKPGEPPYPHMQHYIFSKTLQLEQAADNVKVCPLDLELIRGLKNEEGSEIYLCGGGEFAGWLLEHQLIDIIKIKLNPFLQGQGTRLFGNNSGYYQLELLDKEVFDHGLQIMTYKLKYQ